MAAGSESDIAETTLSGNADEHTVTEPGEALPRGSTVGRYTVLDRIGAGGMGVVYTAFDPQLDRRVALKVMHHGSEGSSGPGGKTRLLREAQAMAKLSHPNVITVHDVGTFSERVFVAMEFIEGTTLRSWQRQSPRDWLEIVHAYVRAGRGLAAAHAAGLVHRDFKPDNVLMGFDGRVLVMDFGLARRAASGAQIVDETAPSPAERSDDVHVTRTGAVLGTPAYMAPEQHRGRGAVGPLADQFSFCVALYEGLYGERPFAGNSVTSLAMNVLEGSVRAAPRDARVPGWLREVVLRGLETDPVDRFPSMDALLAELQRDPPASRRPWLALAGAALVMLAGGIAYGISNDPDLGHCQVESHALDELWNETRKADLREVWLTTNVPFANTAWNSVVARVDSFGTRWRETFVERCEAASQLPRQIREQTPDPGLLCLEMRERELAALLEAYDHGGPLVLRHAVSAAHALPDPRLCNAAPKPSASAEIAKQELRGAVQGNLARAQALVRVGLPDSAAVHLPALLGAAASNELPDIEAAVHLLAAEIEAARRAPDLHALEKTLRKALMAAAKAGAYPLEGEAWARLLDVVGVQQGKPLEGRHLVLGLETALHRTGARDRALRSRLTLHIAALEQTEGHYDVALEHAQRALRLRLDEPWSGELAIAQSQRALGLSLEGSSRFAEAVQAHATALVLLEQTLGAQHPEIAETLLRLGCSLLAAERHNAAEAVLLRARMLLDPTLSGSLREGSRADTIVLAQLLDALGLIQRMREQFGTATERHREAVDLMTGALGEGHPSVGYPLENLGLALADQKDHEGAIHWLKRALDLWTSSLDPEHPDLGLAHLNLANSVWALGDFEGALHHYNQALTIWEATLPSDHPLLGYALTGVGRARLELGEAELALDGLERAFEIRHGDGGDGLNLAETELLLGRALWATDGDPERAMAQILSARDTVGAYEPFERSALRRVLEGGAVPRFTDQLDPAGLSVTPRSGLAPPASWSPEWAL